MDWEEPDPAEIVSLRSDKAWRSLETRYENVIDRPFRRCLEVVRQGGARVAVIETRYIDFDYRSEYSAFFSKKFATMPSTTQRIHFFGRSLKYDDLWELPSGVARSYLGYMVVRPSPLGRVGRTMLAPPPALKSCIDCMVDEEVHFFGQTLTVTGVPFAQQDTQFGRCAHAAAWCCHRTAALRGDVHRRAMAEFSLKVDADAAEGRQIPSPGLTGIQLSSLMRDFDLPPINYRLGRIPRSGQEPPVRDHLPDDDPGTWDTTAVAVICRFLNSGFPVLVGTRVLNREFPGPVEYHAFTVIGYRRTVRDGEPWIEFVRHDDQRGPYLLIDNVVKDLDDESGETYRWQLLLVPVPDKLWLLPEAAEQIGSLYLLAYDREDGTGRLGELEEAGRLTFRTFATTSRHYKELAPDRELDPNSIKEIRLARLSRLIWVVEAVDRDRRSSGEPCVLGEAIFDSTSADITPKPLALRVPGALLVQRTDGVIRSGLESTDQPVRSAAGRQPSAT